MKLHVRCSMAIAVMLGLFSTVHGQDAEQDPQPPTGYVVVNYMKAADGKEDDYVNLEKNVWKKVHEARLKDGMSRGWILYKTVNRPGDARDYDYATIDLYDSTAKMENAFPDDYFSKVLSEDEVKQVNSTESLRTIVRSEVWKPESSAMSGERPEEPVVFVDSMQPSEGKESEYVEAETTVFRKLHQARIDAGNMVAWVFLRRVSPKDGEGSYPFMTINVHKDREQSRLPFADANTKKAFESLDKKQQEMANSMDKIRTLAKRETWIRLDYVLPDRN